MDQLPYCDNLQVVRKHTASESIYLFGFERPSNSKQEEEPRFNSRKPRARTKRLALIGACFTLLHPALCFAQATAEIQHAAIREGWLEPLLKSISIYLASGVEGFAAVIIGAATIEATVRALALFFRPSAPPEAKEAVRLRLGRWLALALEFELAADILRTAIAPTWNEIGQLAAIVVLRTALNFFLQQEIDKAEAKHARSMA